MNIKEISDRLLIESGTTKDHYILADRLVDISNEYLHLIELIIQKEPDVNAAFSFGDHLSRAQVISVTSGTQVSTSRTVIDTAVESVRYRINDTVDWVTLTFNKQYNRYCCTGLDIQIDEKSINIEDPRCTGEIEIRYPRTVPNRFIEDDVTNERLVTIIPDVFQPLLYLRPALNMAAIWKPSHVPRLQAMVDRLDTLFQNHYGRMYNPNVGKLVAGNDCRDCDDMMIGDVTYERV